MKSYKTASCILGLLAVAACNSEHRHTFIDRLGTDTLTIESYVYSDDLIEGDVLIRSPVTRLGHYRADLGARGIERMEISWTTPVENPDGPGPEHSIITFGPDSVTMVKEGGRNPGTLTLASTDDMVPRVGVSPVSFGIFEFLADRASASGQEAYEYRTVSAGSPRVSPNAVTQVSDDTVSISYFGNPMKIAVSGGHITGLTGDATTMKVEAEEIDAVDVGALAAEFAARDTRGEGLGVASPGATLAATAVGANFEIVYSQPAKRGREIFGGLVPWNEVWRTGANAATMFTTDRNLVIAGESVPAGSYTLWTTFSPNQGTLIINSQTGQWGTAYDESQDFVRVPMELTTGDDEVDRFTFDIEEDATSALLNLSWDHSTYSVRMEVR